MLNKMGMGRAVVRVGGSLRASGRSTSRRYGRVRHRHRTTRHRRRSTLLALVQEVQQRAHSDAEVVRVVRWMVNSGVVVLCGNFAGRRF